jgi:hypothetical protein
MAQVQYPFDPATAAADPNLAGAQLDYATNMQQLQYRQDLAKELLKDSDSPYSSGVGARGMAYRVSPWEGVAKMFSGGAGAYMTQQNAKDAAAQGQILLGKMTGTLNPGSQPNPVVPNGGFAPSNPAATRYTVSAYARPRPPGSAACLQCVGTRP